MNALLSDIFFWFKAACEIRLANNGPKHALWSLSDMQFCAYFKDSLKNMQGFFQDFVRDTANQGS